MYNFIAYFILPNRIIYTHYSNLSMLPSKEFRSPVQSPVLASWHAQALVGGVAHHLLHPEQFQQVYSPAVEVDLPAVVVPEEEARGPGISSRTSSRISDCSPIPPQEFPMVK